MGEKVTAGAALPAGVKSSERTLDVLELLAQSPEPLTMTEISRRLSVPKSSLHKLLGTLERRGWVQTDELTHTRYRVGLRALRAGTSFVDADEVVRLTDPILTALSGQFEEATHLGRLDGAEVVYLAKRESTHPLRMFSAVGRRLPAHATAMGKAMLATMDAAEIESLLGTDLAVLTQRTIRSLEELHEDLALTRERGYGIDDEESADMMRAVAVSLPVDGTHNAISLSAPSARLPREMLPDVASAITAAIDRVVPAP
ncbi:transcriptional regulator, IclR family [Beutenbergia cavernae DSM 12333]|uniref:Glycerol operon regulatory protein n=1 Tax=Beutenbergia cavernae (strain ATCC BAA-8 / DSM 12333 / CCUG 43141 / JCM 11478 / NBRC 16432 / NCIMB 13614 / HKI 0122) TaxID=471853 RepID=C5C3P4_BEUC1|nr:IclR family transcriptional regulator [Beutenbergia cavernae]ACQ81953.1 transcriptional regulator, IclR family [Beutenbergia cavernae DSM 12333]